MGTVDIRIKNFVKLNSVFAQLFSAGVFGGRITVEPDKLFELDTVNQETVKLADGQLKDVERLRDAQKISKLFDSRMEFQLIMGVEGQEGVNYFMPVRCMELDALTYSYQCRKISDRAKENKALKRYADGVPKGTRIVPAVTLVFYLGEEPWDAPMSVYDMLDIPEEMKGWARTVIPDYQMNIIDARHMTEQEIDRFEGDLKAFLLMVQENIDEDSLRTVIASHRETWYAVGAVKKDRRYIEYIDSVPDEKIAGGIYMDAVLDRVEARGKARGEAIGEARGEARGVTKGENKVNKLALLLAKEGKLDEFIRSAEDKDYQKQLLKEYGLENE